MFKYDPKSMLPDEFINDAEIQETLAYADAHKNDMALINEILEKARPVKEGNGCRCRDAQDRDGRGRKVW